MSMVADTETIEGEVHVKVGRARGFEVYTDEPVDRIVALVRNAKGGCFAENLVVQKVPLRSSFTLRGQTIELKEKG
jgi:hypothetical protein